MCGWDADQTKGTKIPNSDKPLTFGYKWGQERLQWEKVRVYLTIKLLPAMCAPLLRERELKRCIFQSREVTEHTSAECQQLKFIS